MRNTVKALAIGLSVIGASLLSVLEPAYAWKPNTHVYLSEEALKDAVDDCKISIFRTDYVQQTKLAPIGQYAVDSNLCSALKNHPQQYRAGLLGPDAYPDLLTGQRIIHAEVSRPGGSNAWLEHIWQMQPRNNPRVQAFTLGYLTHAAGDMYAHTLVNNYAGGPFAVGPNAARHVVLEGYIGKRTPSIIDSQGRSVTESSYSITGVEDFIYDSMINARSGSALANDLLIGREADTSVPAVYSGLRERLVQDRASRGTCRGFLGIPDPVCLGIKAYEQAWIEDIDVGLKAWPTVSHDVAKAIVFDTNGSSFSDAEEILSRYVDRHLLSMSGAPDAVGAASEFLGDVVDAIIPSFLEDAITQMKRDLLNQMLSSTFGMTVEEIEAYVKNPEQNFNPVLNRSFGSAERTTLQQFNRDVLKLSDTGYTNPNERFDYEDVSAAYNTVTLSKLIMLSPQGLNQLLNDLGSSARLTEPNVMIGFIHSLDGDNEWHRHGNEQMVLAQDVCAYTQLFMRQDGESWQPEFQNCQTTASRSTPAKTYTSRQLTIPQTWTADLDEGALGSPRNSDLWFRAITATERYIEPLNGATAAISGRRSVGRDGCAAATLSAERIAISRLSEGTYVCMKTNEGRYAQLRVNAPVGASPGTLEVGYTTWKK